jgi:hypothetical protein
MAPQMDSIFAEFDRLLLLRRGWVWRLLRRKLKVVRILSKVVVLLVQTHWVALLLRQKDWHWFVSDQRH